MTEYLWVIAWMLLDNAETVVTICLLGFTAVSWVTVGAFGLFVIWIPAPK